MDDYSGKELHLARENMRLMDKIARAHAELGKALRRTVKNPEALSLMVQVDAAYSILKEKPRRCHEQ